METIELILLSLAIIYFIVLIFFRNVFNKMVNKIDYKIHLVIVNFLYKPLKNIRSIFLKKRYEKWFPESVKYFRSMGFFDEYKSLTNKELENKLATLQAKDYSKLMYNDFDLLNWSKKIFWWISDFEKDVMKGGNVYVKILKEWSNISRGIFRPENIKEIWESETGPIHVSFTLNKKTCTINPKYLDDYVDDTALKQIIILVNKILRESKYNYNFEICSRIPGERLEGLCVIVLSPEEKQKLEKERDWKFENI